MAVKSKSSVPGVDRRSKVAAVALVAMLSMAGAVAAEGWPRQVDATYRITFNGFDIGKFGFRASIDGNSYAAEGDARLSALLGAFKWQGASRSSGVVADLSAQPKGYTFDYAGVGKSGSIKMGFREGNVAQVSVVPQKPAEPGTIAVQASHLAGVLDPLSAVLALSRTTGANPCGRRIPVFDGKQRFDLVLTYARQQRVAEVRPSGQPGVAYVCNVRYVPISGFRMSDETRHMAETSGIEVALRPVPSAGIFIPYQITVPTKAGTATMTSEQVNIVTRREQIAMTH
ncbi:MAG: DUF3108 domain-containing protein [Hyphomicrobiaceae bacterium]|nr:DUF3108 domain-containing protein [Hyphomicrobiaceae bacterium]